MGSLLCRTFSLFSLGIMWLCPYVGAVVSAAPPAAVDRGLPTSVPCVHRGTLLDVSFTAPKSVSYSAARRPGYVETDVPAAVEHPHNLQLKYDGMGYPRGPRNGHREGESGSPRVALSTDADGAAGTSFTVYFVMGLFLSAVGTFISAFGDICMRYSFLRQKRNSVAAVGPSAAEVSRPWVGAALVGVTRPTSVGDAQEPGACRGEATSSIAYSPSFLKDVTRAPAVAASAAVGSDCCSSSSTPASSLHYDFYEEIENVVEQKREFIGQGMQGIQTTLTSAGMSPLPPTSLGCHSVSFEPFSRKPTVPAEIVPSFAAGATRKAAAGAAAAAPSCDSSLSAASTSSSLNCVSAAEHGPSVSADISDSGWNFAVTLSRVDADGTLGSVFTPDGRPAPHTVCPGARRYHVSKEQALTEATPEIVSLLPAVENVTTAATSTSASIYCSTAPNAFKRWLWPPCTWDGYWVVGVSCTCILSPVLSIISLYLLPANITGFAALQIFFVVLLARCLLGEVAHRLNLGGGVLVVAGLVTLTWSTEARSTLPDRANLCTQLASPSAVAFEVCCGCIIVSGLLLLACASCFEQQEREKAEPLVNVTARAAVEEKAVRRPVCATEQASAYAALLPQQERRQNYVEQQYVGLGRERPDGMPFNKAELYACAPASEAELSFQLVMATRQKQLGASLRPTRQCSSYRMLENSAEPAEGAGGRRTPVGFAAERRTVWMPENNAEDASETRIVPVRTRFYWLRWYTRHLSRRRNLLLPLAAGVSGSVASEDITDYSVVETGDAAVEFLQEAA